MMVTRIHIQLDELIRMRSAARGFSLLPRQPINSLLSGQHASRLRGRGLTFEELRGYRPGDDIRQMDWKATARLRKPQIRIYSEERERPILLVVDQRSTMFFGSRRTTKAVAAVEVAALGAWRGLDVGDRVGAILFDDEETIEIRPRRSRDSVLRICHEMVRMNNQLSAEKTFAHSGNRLNDALRRAVQVANHDYLVVLITDYHGDDAETRALATRLVSHNDVLAVLVYDPLGIRLPQAGGLMATDGHGQLSIPTGERFGTLFESEFQKRCDQLRDRLRTIRIPILPICTHESVLDQVRSALGGQP